MSPPGLNAQGSVISLDSGDHFRSFPCRAQASPALVLTAIRTVFWHPDAQTQIQRCKHTTLPGVFYNYNPAFAFMSQT